MPRKPRPAAGAALEHAALKAEVDYPQPLDTGSELRVTLLLLLAERPAGRTEDELQDQIARKLGADQAQCMLAALRALRADGRASIAPHPRDAATLLWYSPAARQALAVRNDAEQAQRLLSALRAQRTARSAS